MQPIRTASANMKYLGPSPDVGDAWAESTRDAAYLTWEPTPDERAAIAHGANLRLGVFQHPMPPVSLDVTGQQAVTTQGAAYIDRAMKMLAKLTRSPLAVPAGYWLVSDDVWHDLNGTGALDTRGVPTLVGRPLMRNGELERDHLEFVGEPIDRTIRYKDDR